jgi:hypothetical protein
VPCWPCSIHAVTEIRRGRCDMREGRRGLGDGSHTGGSGICSACLRQSRRSGYWRGNAPADGCLVISRGRPRTTSVHARKVEDRHLMVELGDERDVVAATPTQQRRWSHPLAGQEAKPSALALGEEAPMLQAEPPWPRPLADPTA